MSYRLSTKTGEVLTWEEFHQAHCIGDNPVFEGQDFYRYNWDEWVPIEVNNNLEEIREKMRFIYSQPISIIDQMRAQQIAYNVAMLKVAQINTTRYDSKD